MASSVEEIKARLSITDVVGSYIKLEKAGGSFKALCPFHHEKTPSFNVSPSRQAYYCFGCNRGGDVFTFVEEIEGVDFLEALKMLADRAGVTLERYEREDKNEKARLIDLMEQAVRFYESGMAEHAGPREYLKDRGLEEGTIAAWHIGYVPPPEIAGWRSIYTHLKGEGYGDQEIEKAGFIKKAEPKPGTKGEAKFYDRFRGRIMFPIRDQSGRTVAFTGRVYGAAKDSEAKYVNSPETELYSKSQVLFGYDMAKSAIRKQNFVVMVEGQMDCIMAHQAGSENVVAVSGTALTEKHLELVKRLTPNIVFAFDADQAGIAATTRAYQMALSMGLNVRVAEIPDAKDPADLILHDPALWGRSLTESRHIIDYLLSVIAAKGLDQLQFRKEVDEKVIPLVISIPSKIEEAHFVQEISRKLDLNEEAVWEEVRRKERAEAFVPRQPVAASERGENKNGELQTPKTLAEEHILSIIYWQEALDEPTIDVGHTRTRYFEILTRHALVPRELSKEEALKLSVKAEHTHEQGSTLVQTIDELLARLEKEVIKERQAELWKKLSGAEAKGEKEEAKKYLRDYQALTPRLLELERRLGQ